MNLSGSKAPTSWLPGFRIQSSRIVRYFPFSFIGLIIAFKFVSQDLYWSIFCKEDGPVEYLTAVAFLIASLFVANNAWQMYREHGISKRSLVVVLVAAFLFVISMEEISWGQRIFDVQSPDFFQENNLQQEITLHNFLSRYWLHMCYIVAGLYGAFAWRIFPKKLQQKYASVTQFLIPHRCLQWYFLPVALLYIYYDYVSVVLVDFFGLSMFAWKSYHLGWIIARDQEPMEFLMAMGFMFFAIMLTNREAEKRLVRQHTTN